MRLQWMADALCGQVGVDEFYPQNNRTDTARVAKRICNGDPRRGTEPCPVRAECLAYALNRNEEHGVWGGLSAPERQKLRRAAA